MCSEPSPPHLVCCSETATATATAAQCNALLGSSGVESARCRLTGYCDNIRHRLCWACVQFFGCSAFAPLAAETNWMDTGVWLGVLGPETQDDATMHRKAVR